MNQNLEIKQNLAEADMQQIFDSSESTSGGISFNNLSSNGVFPSQFNTGSTNYIPTSLQKAKQKLKSSISRDEMNLAEFPLAVLSTRVDSKVKTLEFTDYTRGPKGETVERRWIITGADRFGLPTATDDDVLLGLIRLTMDQDFRDPKVYFTRYELLKILRWSTEGRSYQRLVKSFNRLSGVKINSNSFYDNASKSYQISTFGIIDSFEFNDERAGGEKNSFFFWNDRLFESFKSGYIKKLDLDLYFSLKSAVARRLYRYLDKHFYFKNTLDAHLFTLAFEKIGLSRTYKYVSSIRQQLTPALKELVEIGFLSSYEFLGEGQNSIIRFVAVNGTTSVRSLKQADEENNQRGEVRAKKISGALHVRKNTDEAQQFDFQNKTTANTPTDTTLKSDITALLIERGIMERQIDKLLSFQSLESLKKVRKIIDYYDDLCARSDKRVSKSPIGFLYRAVESPYKITLPEERKPEGSANYQTFPAPPQSRRPEHKIFKAAAPPKTAKRTNVPKTDTIPSTDPRRTQYRTWIDNELTCIMTRMAPAELGELFAETENKMKSLKRILAAPRFQEAIEGCVRDELKRRFRLPSFEGWVEKQE